VRYVYGMSRFAEKFEIQNCVNSMGNWVSYMYGLSEFVEKLNIQNYVNSTGNCVLYSTRNIVYIVCTNCLDLLKIEYLELHIFKRKLCTLYVRNV